MCGMTSKAREWGKEEIRRTNKWCFEFVSINDMWGGIYSVNV